MKNARFIVIGIMMILMFIGGYKTTACAAGEYKAQLILERYELPDTYTIGEDTTIKVVFRNTDKNHDITNILVTSSSTGNSVIPVEGRSNQIYIEAIKAQGEQEIEIPIVITNSESGYASMVFNMEYMSDGGRWTSTSYIVFPVVVEQEAVSVIILKNVNVPENAVENSNLLISTSFLNASATDIFNTSLMVEGDIVGGTAIKSLGTVTTKRNAYGELFVSFATDGEKKVSLYISYEDADGEKHIESIGSYTIDVVKNESVNGTTPSDADIKTDPEANVPIYVLLLIAAGVIAIVIIVVTVINGVRKRRDNYENFDGK